MKAISEMERGRKIGEEWIMKSEDWREKHEWEKEANRLGGDIKKEEKC